MLSRQRSQVHVDSEQRVGDASQWGYEAPLRREDRPFVRSSRKKLAGNAGSSSEIPADAIPEVHLPSFVESLLGGPLVPKMKFLPPDSMVRNLQLASYGVTIMLALLTYIISHHKAPSGTRSPGSIGVAGTMQFIVILGALVTGFYGSLRRDGRFHPGLLSPVHPSSDAIRKQ